jgi:hypothetical protein
MLSKPWYCSVIYALKKLVFYWWLTRFEKWPTKLWHLQAKMTGRNFIVSQTLYNGLDSMIFDSMQIYNSKFQIRCNSKTSYVSLHLRLSVDIFGRTQKFNLTRISDWTCLIYRKVHSHVSISNFLFHWSIRNSVILNNMCYTVGTNSIEPKQTLNGSNIESRPLYRDESFHPYGSLSWKV